MRDDGRQRGSARGQMQKLLGGEVSSCFFPEMLNDEPDSFSLDIRGLEDRPPLLDLSLVVGRECLRILILAQAESPGRDRRAACARRDRLRRRQRRH